MIIFENPGEIDVAAISTFGVSVKETDNPIGFFGTGLKYAIAILLRSGHKVTIHSGGVTHLLGTRQDKVRGRLFDFVTMNEPGGAAKPIGFTTEVGKTWELWMAYRELFCNARDENGDAHFSREYPTPEPDRTFVVVEGDGIEAVHAERWRYFLEDEADIEVEDMRIWRRPSVSFFYRGINVMPWHREAMFTYSQTSKVELTEDRTVKEQYAPRYSVSRAIMRLTDEGMLRRILLAPKDSMESGLDFHGWGTPPAAEFLRVTGELVNAGLSDVNQTANKVWEERQPQEFNPRETELTKVQRATLEKALDFCLKIGLPVRDAYPIKVVDSLGTETMGLAKNETIYLAERAFHMGGTKYVASTLIEEWVHLRHGHGDMTRAMQNWLFDKMVSLGEELTGEPL